MRLIEIVKSNVYLTLFLIGESLLLFDKTIESHVTLSNLCLFLMGNGILQFLIACLWSKETLIHALCTTEVSQNGYLHLKMNIQRYGKEKARRLLMNEDFLILVALLGLSQLGVGFLTYTVSKISLSDLGLVKDFSFNQPTLGLGNMMIILSPFWLIHILD